MSGFDVLLDIDAERAKIDDETSNIVFNINCREKELLSLRRRQLQLSERLLELDRVEKSILSVCTSELIRLCNTPCYRFRAIIMSACHD